MPTFWFQIERGREFWCPKCFNLGEKGNSPFWFLIPENFGARVPVALKGLLGSDLVCFGSDLGGGICIDFD